MPNTIVVGVDGSPASGAAVLWAARRAQRLGSDVQLVHSVPDAWGPAGGQPPGAAADSAARVLEIERDRITALLPISTIHLAVREGEPALVLGTLSRNASMVVVGRDRPADARGEGFGAVGLQIVAASECTVAIIPDTPTVGVGVVVGVDGSPEAERALRVAAGEAESSGQSLTIVLAEAQAPRQGTKPQDAPVTHGAAVGGDQILDTAVAAVAARHPRLEVHRLLDRLHGPAQALALAAEGAGLLVVGSRGREGVKRMRPGAIGSVVFARVACPMLVTTGSAGIR
jgi:nucleotide-binding universal stress UspA family protein